MQAEARTPVLFTRAVLQPVVTEYTRDADVAHFRLVEGRWHAQSVAAHRLLARGSSTMTRSTAGQGVGMAPQAAPTAQALQSRAALLRRALREVLTATGQAGQLGDGLRDVLDELVQRSAAAQSLHPADCLRAELRLLEQLPATADRVAALEIGRLVVDRLDPAPVRPGGTRARTTAQLSTRGSARLSTRGSARTSGRRSGGGFRSALGAVALAAALVVGAVGWERWSAGTFPDVLLGSVIVQAVDDHDDLTPLQRISSGPTGFEPSQGPADALVDQADVAAGAGPGTLLRLQDGTTVAFPAPGDQPGRLLPPIPVTGTGEGVTTWMPMLRQPTSTTMAAAGDPVTYSPCRPVRVLLVEDGAPEGSHELVRAALAEVSDLSGLVFLEERDPGVAATGEWAPVQAVWGDRWAPVRISWSDELRDPVLAGDIGGYAGSIPVPAPDGTLAYVSGDLRLDQLVLSAGTPLGVDDEQIVRQLVMHELGHLLGMDHVPGGLMASVGGPVGDGDRAGFAAVGSGPCQPDL